MYDVIIVGSSVAGSSLAMLLARAGRSVLAVDRATFPRDTRSTHHVVTPGCILLEQWGLLDGLAATGCPPLVRTVLHTPSGVLRMPVTQGVPGARTFAPRRHVLDHYLVEAARAAGTEVREGVALVDVLRDGGRVAGAVLRDEHGRLVEMPAPLVVGADGHRSKTATLVGATTRRRRPVNNAGYYAYWTWDRGDVEVHAAVADGRGEAVVFPTHGGEACIVAACRMEHWPAYRDAPAETYLSILRSQPGLAGWLAGAERRSRLHACGDLTGEIRDASGPGWALVGDAGMFNEPTPGRGISDAFVHAQLLAASLPEDLRDPVTLDEGVARFATARDEWLVPFFEASCDLAQHDWDAPAAAAAQHTLARLGVAEVARLKAGDLRPSLEPTA